MPWNLRNFDAETQKLMLEEMQLDIREQHLLWSPRLSNAGTSAYPNLLETAIKAGKPEALIDALKHPGYMNEYEDKGGKQVRVPKHAAEVLGEGEFNRYYMRAICRQSLQLGKQEVRIYRGKEVEKPSPESEKKLGKLL